MSYQSGTEEQFDELKSFLAKSWKIIVAVIVIGLLSIWGWRYWQSNQEQKILDASLKYERLVSKLDLSNTDSVEELVVFAKNTDTIYRVFANMKAAQFYVEANQDYMAAQNLLSEAVKSTDSETILSMLNIRIARLQLQQAQYQDSLDTLNKVTDDSWSAVVNDIRGDVLVKMERFEEAVNAYEVALVSSPTPEISKNVQMKLNQVQYLKAKLDAEKPDDKDVTDGNS